MRRQRPLATWRFTLPLVLLPCLAGPAAAEMDINSLSIEQLANIEVTSVSKRPEKLAGAAASVFVITRDDIRRSGARSIPEILRLAPNLQVARLDASNYAISARGFNHQTATADKLLVLMDGRAVYSPLFSGVFWDQQNFPIADIERIEVISGPAGAVWGVNAVNGVINIITRTAKDTSGTLAEISGGSLDNSATLRQGGTLGANAAWRVYAMGQQFGHLQKLNGAAVANGWRNGQAGLRLDWSQDNDSITLAGDLYGGVSAVLPGQVARGTIGGENIRGNWTRSFSDGSAFTAQAYYDNARRDVTSGIRASVDTFDFDTQYEFLPWADNQISIGGGYRATWDRLVPGPGTVFLSPATRKLETGTLFAQDLIALTPALDLTAGIRLISDSYTGIEYAPDARLAWHLSGSELVWASVSRAVRAPSRFDADLYNTGVFAGGPDFRSEDLLAFEFGYRGQPLAQLSLSISTFYNIYDELRTIEASTAKVFPLVVKNGMAGDTYGVEAWATYALTDWWRLNAGVSALAKTLRLSPGSRDIFGVQYAGNDPSYQAQLRSDMDLPRGFQLELGVRNVAALPSPAVPSYVEGDASINWQVVDGVTLMLTGNNLFHARHQEFINGSLAPQAVPRSVSLGLRLEM